MSQPEQPSPICVCGHHDLDHTLSAAPDVPRPCRICACEGFTSAGTPEAGAENPEGHRGVPYVLSKEEAEFVEGLHRMFKTMGVDVAGMRGVGGPLIGGLIDRQIASYLESKVTPEAMTALIVRLKDAGSRVMPALVEWLSSTAWNALRSVDARAVGESVAAELRGAVLPAFQND